MTGGDGHPHAHDSHNSHDAHDAQSDELTHLCTLSDDWADTFRLLGDPTRLRLLTLLHYEGPGDAEHVRAR